MCACVHVLVFYWTVSFQRVRAVSFLLSVTMHKAVLDMSVASANVSGNYLNVTQEKKVYWVWDMGLWDLKACIGKQRLLNSTRV